MVEHSLKILASEEKDTFPVLEPSPNHKCLTLFTRNYGYYFHVTIVFRARFCACMTAFMPFLWFDSVDTELFLERYRECGVFKAVSDFFVLFESGA